MVLNHFIWYEDHSKSKGQKDQKKGKMTRQHKSKEGEEKRREEKYGISEANSPFICRARNKFGAT